MGHIGDLCHRRAEMWLAPFSREEEVEMFCLSIVEFKRCAVLLDRRDQIRLARQNLHREDSELIRNRFHLIQGSTTVAMCRKEGEQKTKRSVGGATPDSPPSLKRPRVGRGADDKRSGCGGVPVCVCVLCVLLGSSHVCVCVFS